MLFILQKYFFKAINAASCTMIELLWDLVRKIGNMQILHQGKCKLSIAMKNLYESTKKVDFSAKSLWKKCKYINWFSYIKNFNTKLSGFKWLLGFKPLDNLKISILEFGKWIKK